MISKATTKSRRAISRSAGFSIVEVLIALLILGAGMLALVRLQTSMTDGASVAKQRTEATKLAQKKVEELRSFTTAGAFDNQFSGSPPATCNAVTIQGENTTYTLSCTATVTAANSLQGRFAALTVSVSWKDQKSQDHAVQLQTTVTRASPADAGLLLTPAPNSTVYCAPGDSKQWSVNSVSCQGSVDTAGSSGTVVTVISSTNTGNNQYQCTPSGWVEVAGYAKTCDQSCTGTTRTWQGTGGEQCTASLAASLVGSTLAVTDSAAPVTGSASYQCLSGGTWATNPNAGATCTAVCASQPVNWNGTGQNLTQCTGTLGNQTFSAAGGNTASFNNSTTASGVTITATATYTCANTGAWSLTNSVCSSTSTPSNPTSCPQTSVTWGTAPSMCAGTLSAASIGGTGTASQNSGGTTGNASYTCNSGGTWALSTSTCSACTVSLSGARVSTATRFWFRVDGSNSAFTEITGTNGTCTITSTTNNNKTTHLFSCTSVPISGNTRTTYELKSTNAAGTDVGNTNIFRTNNSDGATCGSNYINEDLCTGNAC